MVGKPAVFNRYRIHKLIKGGVLGPQFGSGYYIAVPTKLIGRQLLISYGVKEYMLIEKGTVPVTAQTFDDKYRPGERYELSYFEWKPTINPLSIKWSPRKC